MNAITAGPGNLACMYIQNSIMDVAKSSEYCTRPLMHVSINYYLTSYCVLFRVEHGKRQSVFNPLFETSILIYTKRNPSRMTNKIPMQKRVELRTPSRILAQPHSRTVLTFASCMTWASSCSEP
ncbi:hypothetical protein PMIN02_010081 [Paraphaeosphaeria minitans]